MNEAHQYNKPQQKAGANTSIILGHFQKRLTATAAKQQKNLMYCQAGVTVHW